MSRPRSNENYDLVVLGGGSAGLVAAVVGASLGAKTVLIERDRLGGDCTWHGCIPSKTLLHVASVAASARSAGRFGIDAGEPSVHWGRVREWLERTRQTIFEQADSPRALAQYGVRTLAGNGRFLDAKRLHVEGSTSDVVLTARRFMICTGSSPTVLDLTVPHLTSDTIFDMPAMPQRMIIVGSGPIGIELAQAFARLGTSVHVVSRDSRILAHDDADHALALQIALEREGVRFTFGTEVLDARIAGEERVVRLTDGCELRADAILAAVGRTPRVTGFGLEDCGVEVADGAIRVDDRCRTTVPRIYAAGDVTGPPFFTHAGEEMSKVAVANALLHIPRRYDRKRIPWCTFTAPELAHVGLTEATLRSRGIRHQILSFPNGELDRAVVDGETTGSTKLFVDRRGRVLGASILSSRAGEAAAEIALAIAAKLSVTRIADVVHAYPSYGYGPRRAADGWYTQKITPCVLRLLRTIFGFRGNAR